MSSDEPLDLGNFGARVEVIVRLATSGERVGRFWVQGAPIPGERDHLALTREATPRDPERVRYLTVVAREFTYVGSDMGNRAYVSLWVQERPTE
jgi:hypothetical protein